MMNFTLNKSQEAAREYAHQVAVEEMRPISLEVIAVSRYQNHSSGICRSASGRGAAGQARMQEQGEERQTNVLSVLSRRRWPGVMPGFQRPSPAPGPSRAPYPFSWAHQSSRRDSSGPYMDGQLHWGALALTEPGIGSDVAGMSTTAVLEGDEWVINGHSTTSPTGRAPTSLSPSQPSTRVWGVKVFAPCGPQRHSRSHCRAH